MLKQHNRMGCSVAGSVKGKVTSLNINANNNAIIIITTRTTAHLKTPLSSSWSLQTTPHWSASSRTVTSLLTDKKNFHKCGLNEAPLHTESLIYIVSTLCLHVTIHGDSLMDITWKMCHALAISATWWKVNLFKKKRTWNYHCNQQMTAEGHSLVH